MVTEAPAMHAPIVTACASANPGGISWLGKMASAQLLGVGPKRLDRIVSAGRVRIRELPGDKRRTYCRQDLEAMLASAVRHAGSENANSPVTA